MKGWTSDALVLQWALNEIQSLPFPRPDDNLLGVKTTHGKLFNSEHSYKYTKTINALLGLIITGLL